MKGLISYGAVTAKVRALEGKLLTIEDYKKMAELPTVAEAVEFLRTFPAYSQTFENLSDASLHRGVIEQLLAGSLFHEYTKLYQFCSMKQRYFLDFYFMHFEIDILKRCLRNAAAHKPEALGLYRYDEFFREHSDVPLGQISQSASLDEFLGYMRGTIYEQALLPLMDREVKDSFAYETALDLFYFKKTWRDLKAKIPKWDREMIRETLGIKIEILNLQWIYRGKKYYSMVSDQIRTMLVPIRSRLKKEQLNELIESSTAEDFYQLLSYTWYGKMLKKADMEDEPDLEILYRFILNRLHTTLEKEKPYSIASMYSYLYFKEAELKKIITVIEGIRYQVPSKEIIQYIANH